MRRSLRGVRLRGFVSLATLLTTLALPSVSHAQVAITEIMYDPGGDDDLWEWIEIRNITGSPLDLDGWVFDDDDDANLSDPQFGAANINSVHGNTIVPTGGVAILYAAEDLEYMPQRFTGAWGSGLTLVPVSNFTSMTSSDAIGLWSSASDYLSDATSSTTSPRRTFNHAVASINYSSGNGFPNNADGESIVWKGTGSITSGTNWAASMVGLYDSFTSTQTVIDIAPLNSTDDLGNPGLVPVGASTPGLRITEVMFDPASPIPTVGYSETDFEWIELHNNTGANIDFAATDHFLDDVIGPQLTIPNITSGSLAAGDTGILFNSRILTEADMQAIWGAGLNYIPVANWPPLNNGLETIGIWDSPEDYAADADTGAGRTFNQTVATVTYNTVADDGWPAKNDQSSFYLTDLTLDPSLPTSWERSDEDDPIGSYHPDQFFQTVVDHPGGDVGSPGVAPPFEPPNIPGDYNASGTVDAADYVVWRNNLNTSVTLPNDTTPGTVTEDDYVVWRMNFGNTAGAGANLTAAVPEPSAAVVALIACAALAIRARFQGVPLLAALR